MNEENVKVQMRKGILEYCILAILSREDSYAPKIIAELKQAQMIVVEGTLYPILYRLEDDGLVESRWSVPRDREVSRKYYRITDKGQRELSEMCKLWQTFQKSVSLILDRD